MTQNADSVPTEATTTCTACRVPLAWHPSFGWIAFPAHLNATDEPEQCPRSGFGHEPKQQNDGSSQETS